MPTLHLNPRDTALLQRIVARLYTLRDSRELRSDLGEHLLRLLRADHFASFVWNPEHRTFEQAVSLNMSADNLARYDAYFQFHDPITHRLQRRRTATPVQAIMPQPALERTEFFNDFLARDGLHHGINLYAWDAGRNTGDLRIWRRRGRKEFDGHDVALLEFIKPHFRNAMRNAASVTTPAIASATAHMTVARTGEHGHERLDWAEWDALPLPCALFRGDGHCLHANPPATALLRADAAAGNSLRHALATFALTGALADQQGSYSFSRLIVHDAAARPLVAVLLHPASPAPINADSLRQRFRLSPREAQVALLAAKGLTDRDLAQVLGIGFATVRTHLDAALRKTGASNRAELAHALFAEQIPLFYR